MGAEPVRGGSAPSSDGRALPARMLRSIERMGDQLPPRLKAVLNLAITTTLVVLAIPLLWSGIAGSAWSDVSLGAGLLLLGVFNLFT